MDVNNFKSGETKNKYKLIVNIFREFSDIRPFQQK